MDKHTAEDFAEALNKVSGPTTKKKSVPTKTSVKREFILKDKKKPDTTPEDDSALPG